MPSTADSALAARRAREVKRDPGLLYTDQAGRTAQVKTKGQGVVAKLRLRDLLSISPRGLPFDLPVTRLTLSLERGDVLVLEEDSGWRIPKDSFKFDDGLRTGVVISLFSSADLVVSFAVHFRNLPLHSPAFFPLAGG
ncbi:unnamed protein product [Cyprideis torosa]|uniref:Uncharacterized protein n=1 Tax=Cyprideis torosa TaxID=163714 RepID=A0A7R8WF36_9CRUS|nr:unnamed protein product [Cyprideis torosa]CAG0896505.1 unnamed protein product [Cyprideis torosa]